MNNALYFYRAKFLDTVCLIEHKFRRNIFGCISNNERKIWSHAFKLLCKQLKWGKLILLYQCQINYNTSNRRASKHKNTLILDFG